MSNKVDPNQIEEIVGTKRNRKAHIGKFVSEEDKVYIMHSRECVVAHEDLRQCKFSLAMDTGLPEKAWNKYADKTVLLGIMKDFLVPLIELNEAGQVKEDD